MSSLFTNLLFMHGHIADLELARRLAGEEERGRPPKGKRQPAPKAEQQLANAVAVPSLAAQGGCG
ncbi:hypothetical protein [Dyella sp. C9]|uniref:hypothetical protein n=1 Tax=Dyella sp. C9 TaxID=2202154 RepID=UPI000DEF5E06|nr:hypothetical protein [Dyella sp. C9]